jgi:hypothetical protein
MHDEELRSSLADVLTEAARRGVPDVGVLRQRIRRRAVRRWVSGALVVLVIAGIGLGVNASLSGTVPERGPVAVSGAQPPTLGTWFPASGLTAADSDTSAAPYLISLTNPPSGPASVENAASGVQIGAITPPCKCTYIGAAAAGDDRTFVLAASSGRDIKFYEVRLGTAGTPGAAQLLLIVPAASVPQYLDFALSPDASMLAYTTRTGLTVVSLPTRKTLSWPSVSGTASEFSWAADDHTLAFMWWPQSTSGAAQAQRGVRVLGTRNPGSILGASRLVIPVHTLTYNGGGYPLITADGSKILASYDVNLPGFSTPFSYSYVGEFSVRTGKLLANVTPAPDPHGFFDGVSCQAVWADASGRQVASSCSGGSGDMFYNGHKAAGSSAFQVSVDPTSEPSPDGSFGQLGGQSQMGPLIAW